MPKTPLPSLFGRFTTILSDHRDLGMTLARLEKMCVALEAAERRLEPELVPGPLIAGFRARLREHFRAEEGNAYFGAIARDMPEMREAIQGLVAEHVSMLDAVGALNEAADAARHAEIPGPMRRLIEQLRAHEAAETRLLHAYFHDEAHASHR